MSNTPIHTLGKLEKWGFKSQVIYQAFITRLVAKDIKWKVLLYSIFCRLAYCDS